MEKINDYMLSPVAMIMVAGSSKGAQKKYYEDNKWYKENHVGYEGTAEHLASLVLSCSNIEHYVWYDKCKINGKNGCVSDNFLGKDEAYISLDRLHDMYIGGKISDIVYEKQDINERIEYVENFVKEYTGLDIHDYLAKMLTFDALILNTDRHFNNIGIICDAKENKYKFAPIFDNGRSLLSETAIFPFDISVEENIKNVMGKPFAANLEYQAHVFNYRLKIDYNKLYTLLEKEEASRALEVLKCQLEHYREKLDINHSKNKTFDEACEDAKHIADNMKKQNHINAHNKTNEMGL